MDDDPLTSPSFPAINTSDSRSYRTRRPGASQSGQHTGPQPISPYAHEPAPVRPAPVPPASPTVANPYGSYVSAPQPVYQDLGQSHPDAASYGPGYPSTQQADGSWYAGAATGYLPPGYASSEYPSGDRNGNGNGYADNGSNSAGGHGYAAVDYPNDGYQGYQPSPVAPVAPVAPGGYGPQGQYAPQYDQRGYSAPDVAYGQDGYQGYPGYGTGTR
jgi:hypothetical protein